jgi:outer membrane protein OmpA-like peptidoglycan-associated protein
MVSILRHKFFISLVAIMYSFVVITGCNASKAAKGGAIGAAAGGVVGGVIGKKAGNTLLGAIIGAAVGGATGAIIGRYMDKQAAELQRDLQNAKIERVGEGIKITFDSGILFDVNSFALKAESRKNIEDLARVLQKYPDTNILIEGHTDATGTPEHNQTLSENRANAVSTYLKTQGVTAARITNTGYGENQPVEDNASESGKRANRRVEVAIIANEKLKKAAEKGELPTN